MATCWHFSLWTLINDYAILLGVKVFPLKSIDRRRAETQNKKTYLVLEKSTHLKSWKITWCLEEKSVFGPYCQFRLTGHFRIFLSRSQLDHLALTKADIYLIETFLLLSHYWVLSSWRNNFAYLHSDYWDDVKVGFREKGK